MQVQVLFPALLWFVQRWELGDRLKDECLVVYDDGQYRAAPNAQLVTEERKQEFARAKETLEDLNQLTRDDEALIKRGLNSWYLDLVEQVRRARPQGKAPAARERQLAEQAALRGAALQRNSEIIRGFATRSGL